MQELNDLSGARMQHLVVFLKLGCITFQFLCSKDVILCQFADVRMCPFLVKGCVIVDVRMQNWCVDAIFRGVRMCGACGRGVLFLR